MPFRHQSELSTYEFVMRLIEKKEQMNLKSNELLQRFRKQTLRRLQHLQDRALVSYRISCILLFV